MKFSFEGTEEEWNRFCRKALPGRTVDSAFSPKALKAPSEELKAASQWKKELPSLSEDVRQETWTAFCEAVKAWEVGFDDPESEQPDRLAILRKLGSGPTSLGILVMAYEVESLQKLVWRAVEENGEANPDLAKVHAIAANMVQISCLAFPDLAGTLDYTEKWQEG